MGKMVVTATNAIPKSSTANVALVEVVNEDDQNSTNMIPTPRNVSTINLVIPIENIDQYLVGTEWNMTLSKVTSV